MSRRSELPITGRPGGFTLVELAVVLVILALLAGGLIMSLSAQQDVARRNSSDRSLAAIQEALIGFAAAQGRLPCPATDDSAGNEYFCKTASDCSEGKTTGSDHGRCLQFFNGYIPGATLGLAPLDDKGRVLDAWNNPIRYSVTDKTISTIKYAFTRKEGLREARLENLAGLVLLNVCKADPGSGVTACGTNNVLTTTPPAVLLSTGQYGLVSTNSDAKNNRNNDDLFISHLPNPPSGTDTGFDDLVVWISPHILYSRMIAAGRLP